MKMKEEVQDSKRWIRCPGQRLIRTGVNPRGLCSGNNGSNGAEGAEGSSQSASKRLADFSQDAVPISERATQKIGTDVVGNQESPLGPVGILNIVEFEGSQEDVDVKIKIEPEDASIVKQECSNNLGLNEETFGNDKTATLKVEILAQEECIVPKEEVPEGQDCADDDDSQVIGKLASVSVIDQDLPPTQLVELQHSDCGFASEGLDTHQASAKIVEDTQEDGFVSGIRELHHKQVDQNQNRHLQQQYPDSVVKLVKPKKKKPYKCNFCASRYSTVRRRHAHEVKLHPVFSQLDPDFQMCRCELCPLMLFKTTYGFLKHVEKRHVQEFKVQKDQPG